jgi:hypothetical protein
VGPGPADAEDGGIDGDRLVGGLLLHRRQAGWDRAEDGHLEELRLHGGGLEAPGAARQLLDLPLVRQRAQVPDHGRLAGRRNLRWISREDGGTPFSLWNWRMKSSICSWRSVIMD